MFYFGERGFKNISVMDKIISTTGFREMKRTPPLGEEQQEAPDRRKRGLSDLRRVEPYLPPDLRVVGDTSSMGADLQVSEPALYAGKRMESVLEIFKRRPSMSKLFLPQ
jgi:hypothetical protein